eukprot:3474256-Rhodomonas_salina.1
MPHIPRQERLRATWLPDVPSAEWRGQRLGCESGPATTGNTKRCVRTGCVVAICTQKDERGDDGDSICIRDPNVMRAFVGYAYVPRDIGSETCSTQD